MIRPIAGFSLVALAAATAFGQSTKSPAFDVADVHVSAYTRNPYMRGGVQRGGRYEMRKANMVDLIRTAYGVEADFVVGGPSWLESDRFDVIAKTAPATSPESIRLMLQALLADRFKLVVHQDIRPMPAFILSVGKGKPKMKEAAVGGNTGCEPQPPGPPQPGGIPPNNVVNCRNVTMAQFAPMLRNLANGYTDQSCGGFHRSERILGLRPQMDRERPASASRGGRHHDLRRDRQTTRAKARRAKGSDCPS